MKKLIVTLLLLASLISEGQKQPVTHVSTFKIDSVWVGIGPPDKQMYEFEEGKRISHYPINGTITVYSSDALGHKDYFIISEPILKIQDTMFFKITGNQVLDKMVILSAVGNRVSSKSFDIPQYNFYYILMGKTRRVAITEADFPTKRTLYFITMKDYKIH